MVTKKEVGMISGVVIIAFCIYSILTSASQFANPYLSLVEVTNNPTSFMGKQIQMIGNVVNGSIQSLNGNITFQIADEDIALTVTYSGSLPQNFREGIDVVVIGTLNSEQIFKAQEILTKCPSKYQ